MLPSLIQDIVKWLSRSLHVHFSTALITQALMMVKARSTDPKIHQSNSSPKILNSSIRNSQKKMLPCSQAAQMRQAESDTLRAEYRIKLPEYSMTSSGVFPSTSRAIFSMSSRPHFSLALMNWLKSLLFQLVKPCTAIKRKHCTEF